MQAKFHVRTAVESDVYPLLALLKQLSPQDPDLLPENALRIWGQIQAYPGSAVFVGLIDEVLVATCTLIVIPNLTRGGMSYSLIENVVTDPGHRKRGYGRILLQEAAKAAWNANCYKVMLLTGSKDPATLRFYENAGFSQDKTGFQMRRLPRRIS